MIQINVETAIKIARIIAYCPEERLPMIVDVFDKAEIDINGLDELVELKAKSKLNVLINTEEFVRDVKKLGRVKDNETFISIYAFNEFCKERDIPTRAARKHLYQEGYLRAVKERKKLVYSVSVYENGKNMRYIVLKNKEDKEGVSDE